MEVKRKKLTVKDLVSNMEKVGQLRGVMKSTPPKTENEKAYHEALGYMVDAYENLTQNYLDNIA